MLSTEKKLGFLFLVLVCPYKAVFVTFDEMRANALDYHGHDRHSRSNVRVVVLLDWIVFRSFGSDLLPSSSTPSSPSVLQSLIAKPSGTITVRKCSSNYACFVP